MKLASVRIITDDVEKLASFYEFITGLKVIRYTPVFAELRTPTFTLAIGGKDRVSPELRYLQANYSIS